MTTEPHIALKRVYDTPAASDGVRILVDRLWPRGEKKSDVPMDHWLKGVAPSPELRKWFGHDPAKWTEFSKRYRAELEADKHQPDMQTLLHEAAHHPVTLLYAAHDTQHTHALVLADFLRDALQGKA